jgi:ribosomal protein L35
MAKRKIKTKKTLLRRVKITKTGKIMKKSIGMGHLKEKKSSPNKSRNTGLSKQKNSGHRKMFKKMLNKHGKEI